MDATAVEQAPAAAASAGGRMLTPTQVHEITGIALSTLTNWRSQGRGPAWVKVSGQRGRSGGRVRYPEQELLAYLKARTVSGGDR